MDIQTHIAKDADASAISETIIKTLRESNARDYSSEIIDRVIERFSPSKILRLLAERQVLVAALDNAALGFKKVRDEFHQEERTIIMAKTLKR